MSARHERQTAAEARRGLAADPDHPSRHEAAILVYLPAPAYVWSRSSHAADEEPRPVDEPAPQPAPASLRGKPRHGR
jgi:hypothetical protein